MVDVGTTTEFNIIYFIQFNG